MTFALRRTLHAALAVAVLLTCKQGFAQEATCPVGVNVNSFQNLTAAEQQGIVEQLKGAGVRFVRTSLRPDDKNLTLAKNLQSVGIGLVLVLNPEFSPDARPRPGDPQRHLRSAMPLSSADPMRSRVRYQEFFDKLDSRGVALAGVELGNEVNWADFNGDFTIPGRGKAFTLDDLSRDVEAQQVARGFLQYLKVAAALKDVRDHSRLNRHAPIISAGMAAANGEPWQQKLQVDSVSIPAAYAFLRAHGLDALVDGYGVHDYPAEIAAGDRTAAEQRDAHLDQTVFPPGGMKPYWLTEWGFPSDAVSSADDQTRARSVSELRAYLLRVFRQGRLGGMFWYVWNEPDRKSIYREGALVDAGRRAIAPMPTR